MYCSAFLLFFFFFLVRMCRLCEYKLRCDRFERIYATQKKQTISLGLDTCPKPTLKQANLHARDHQIKSREIKQTKTPDICTIILFRIHYTNRFSSCSHDMMCVRCTCVPYEESRSVESHTETRTQAISLVCSQSLALLLIWSVSLL